MKSISVDWAFPKTVNFASKLMDMNEFYLIAKEPPSANRGEDRVRRYFHMEVRFENGRKNHVNKELRIFSCF